MDGEEMDWDMSIELSRARRTVELASELLGDTRGLEGAQIELRERACALLYYAARELQGVEKALYPA